MTTKQQKKIVAAIDPAVLKNVLEAVWQVWSDIANDQLAAVGKTEMPRAEVIEVIGDRCYDTLWVDRRWFPLAVDWWKAATPEQHEAVLRERFNMKHYG
jgi:hypothetical protein